MLTKHESWKLAPPEAAAPLRAQKNRMPAPEFAALVQDHKAPKKQLSEKAFARKFGYSYDAVMVFDYDEKKLRGQPSKAVRTVLFRLNKGRVEHSWFVSSTKEEQVILLRASVHRFAKLADDLDWPLPLDEAECEARARAGDVEHGIKPFAIFHDPAVTHGFSPYQSIFAKYDTEPSLQALYAVPPGRPPLLLEPARLLPAPRRRRAPSRAAALLHVPLRHVRRSDAGLPRRARVGMYLGFVAHKTSWMRAPAALSMLCTLGLWVEVNVLDRDRRRSRVMPIFAFFMCLWASTMLEAWKRKQFAYALRWGMLGGDAEPDRPEFVGVPRPSLVDGRPETYFPALERRARERVSAGVLFLCILVVLAFASLPIAVRVYLEQETSGFTKAYAAFIASACATAQIEVMNYCYSFLATYLNDRENHRTNQRYMNALASKLFFFNFFNFNVTLTYSAFVQRGREGCGDEDKDADQGTCYKILEQSLGTIFLTKTLANYESDELKSNIADMNVLAIRFSFSSLYILSLPAIVALSWIANFTEGHNDVRKFLHSERRQWPCAAASIGSWTQIYKFIASLAVVTNTCTLFFTVRWTPFADRALDDRERVAAAFVAQYIIFTIMFVIEAAVPDTPYFVDIQLRRQAFIASKLVDRLPDEEDDSEPDDEPPSRLKSIIQAKILDPMKGAPKLADAARRASSATPRAARPPATPRAAPDVHALCAKHDPAFHPTRNPDISLATFSKIAEDRHGDQSSSKSSSSPASLSGLGGAGASSSDESSRTSFARSARTRFASVRSAAVWQPVSSKPSSSSRFALTGASRFFLGDDGLLDGILFEKSVVGGGVERLRFFAAPFEGGGG
ncbi:intracellular chloride channel [Aureococcus anophagefferens]|nr:intracellular chloride channel [Aureococcus anophagefferens]